MRELFDYTPIVDRPRLDWPDGARVAVWVGLNIEHYPAGQRGVSIDPHTAGLPNDPLNESWRDYGLRVGVWRIADALTRHGVPATAIVNSDLCELYPAVVERGRELGWAWMAHGKNNTILQTEMEPDVERRYLGEVLDTIERRTGRRPSGWLGPGLTETPNTPGILAELGLTYLCDWCNDDQPYPLRVESGRMISVPYSVEVNDLIAFLVKEMSGPDYERMLVDQFDQLYAEGAESGRVMAIPLHAYLTGLPFRIAYLSRALEHIASHDEVWLTTADQIADWYFEHHYREPAGAAASGS